MRPILRVGSFGPDVRSLQSILNTKPTRIDRLTVDGAFGGQTRQRVCEFQSMCRITPDGVVGNATWSALLGTGAAVPPPSVPGANNAPPPPNTPENPADISSPAASSASPGSEDAARQKICEIALNDWSIYKWTRGDKPKPGDPRVAGKLCADHATRERQGGKHIAEIFQVAGAPNPNRCLTLSPQAEAMYNRQYTASERNNTDIVSWCGIFTLYCYKTAGLRLSGWPYKYSIGKQKPGDEMRIKLPNKPPKPGDVGIVEPGGLNHHFMIVDVQGDQITSIDGNSGWYMEIVKQNYTLGGIRQKNGYFIEPVWDNVL